MIALIALFAVVAASLIDGPVVGVDLGLTNSVVAMEREGRVEVMHNAFGNRVTPSVVAFAADGERLVGEAAKKHGVLDPKNTVFDVKRLLGRRFDSQQVQRDLKLLPYDVVDRDNRPMISVTVKGEQTLFSPEEISAMILTHMKETAEAFLGQPVRHAVLTMPTHFDDAQRFAMTEVSRLAGLNMLRFMPEPTAVALAYGLNHRSDKENIIVFDLGGGAFDVTLLTVDAGVFEVVATAGDARLGGEKFDQRVIDHFLKLFKTERGKDASQDRRAVAKLRQACERAKHTLSRHTEATIDFEDFFGGEDFAKTLTRAQFEELNIDLFYRTLGPVESVLADAKLKRHEIDEVLFVGGSSRIPKLRQMLKDFFGGKEPLLGINPDEVIAYGAAVHGSTLMKKPADHGCMVHELTPFSLGVATAGGQQANIIPRNSAIPTKKSVFFTTRRDDQTHAHIDIFEGDRLASENNRQVGSLVLTGIPPMPRGVPQIKVTFELDVDAVLHVRALEMSSGSAAELKVSREKLLIRSYEDIERMVEEAERMLEQDRAALDAQCQLDRDGLVLT